MLIQVMYLHNNLKKIEKIRKIVKSQSTEGKKKIAYTPTSVFKKGPLIIDQKKIGHVVCL